MATCHCRPCRPSSPSIRSTTRSSSDHPVHRIAQRCFCLASVAGLPNPSLGGLHLASFHCRSTSSRRQPTWAEDIHAFTPLEQKHWSTLRKRWRRQSSSVESLRAPLHLRYRRFASTDTPKHSICAIVDPSLTDTQKFKGTTNKKSSSKNTSFSAIGETA